MPKGGHVNSGPPPDPTALRRNRPGDAAWSSLPAVGRTDPAPDWPLTEQTDREAHLWVDLWRRPQAVMWEKLGQWYEVAMCVRMLARAEAPKSSIELQKVVRQYFDSLGLSTQGMLRNRWRIEPSAAASPPATSPGKAKQASSRSRLAVVRDEAGG